MNAFIRSSLPIVFSIVLGCIASAAPQDFAGTWHNELKSEMELKVDSAGNVTGTYRSLAGEGDHKPKSLTGFADGNAIAFTVHFDDATTVTAWTGHLVDGKITTLWQLVFPASADNVWKATWTGTDTFTTGPAPSK